MPRESIVGSGRKGFGFEQKGFQERNLALLLETLSKKEVQKSIEALAKFEKDEWVEMANTATSLNNFVALGGVSTLTSSIKETIKLQIDSLLSPLTNNINQAITDIIAPFIADILQPMINDLNDFLAVNTTGAGIGGIVGSIASIFLPGGPLLVALGAIIGAAIESALALLPRELEVQGVGFLSFGEWMLQGLGNTWNDYYNYLLTVAKQSIPESSGSGRIGGIQDVF